jgi:hypothetical protein
MSTVSFTDSVIAEPRPILPLALVPTDSQLADIVYPRCGLNLGHLRDLNLLGLTGDLRALEL